ncbi:N(G),N(G)-dimethylarginine dimethylaminohydrolase [Actinorhabdospora filicis]|uniref:N(G),N(G)-dimethylarginine dimethylaminohydrolase n=1 Tax=Actinorhabdospora filicis TaxID=1785913 RepID=A0A9W6W880_9ACTN|nr:dimethylargininase [Actinorhabdospora filicis]GLZ76703.1 N(G),N(G)-dimethylarginine dimethylaminohydrolase [Actinorhabdospora filicis]
MIALVRRPGPRLTEGLVTHIERVPVSSEAALAQWDAYVTALTENGWRCLEVLPADDHPDAVFIEDTVVMWRNAAVLTRPGAPERRGEVDAVESHLADLGCFTLRVQAPGTLDGGDVLKIGDTVYVGRGGRTNAAGIAQLRAALTPLGARVVAVPVTRVLHLKSAVTALPDGTVIGHPPLVDDPGLFPSFLPVPEESGAHVVDLGSGRLLIATSAPRTTTLLADLGWHPVPVDIGEFEKLEGCVTCLSVRLRGTYPNPHRAGR